MFPPGLAVWHTRCLSVWRALACWLKNSGERRALTMIALLYNPLFWDKKVRIAILTLATFAALC